MVTIYSDNYRLWIPTATQRWRGRVA